MWKIRPVEGQHMVRDGSIGDVDSKHASAKVMLLDIAVSLLFPVLD